MYIHKQTKLFTQFWLIENFNSNVRFLIVKSPSKRSKSPASKKKKCLSKKRRIDTDYPEDDVLTNWISTFQVDESALDLNEDDWVKTLKFLFVYKII